LLIISVIQEEQLKYLESPPRPSKCQHCGFVGNQKFVGDILRKVRYLENYRVNIVNIFVGLWRCPNCRRCFRFLPKYIERFKRFVKENHLKLARRYLTQNKLSYLRVAETDHGRPQVYEQRDGALSRTSIWRWVGMYGDVFNSLLVKFAVAGRSPPAHSPVVFPPWKYKKPERKVLLGKAHQVIELIYGFETVLI
jgi:hypothetical protein